MGSPPKRADFGNKERDMHAAARDKVVNAKLDELFKLNAKFEKHLQLMDQRDLAKKYDTLTNAMVVTRSSLKDVETKLRDTYGIQKELSKAPAQVKILAARVEALSKEVEALKKDQISSADLKALEKRVMAAIKKGS